MNMDGYLRYRSDRDRLGCLSHYPQNYEAHSHQKTLLMAWEQSIQLQNMQEMPQTSFRGKSQWPGSQMPNVVDWHQPKWIGVVDVKPKATRKRLKQVRPTFRSCRDKLCMCWTQGRCIHSASDARTNSNSCNGTQRVRHTNPWA